MLSPGALTASTYVPELGKVMRPELLVAHAYVRYLGDLSGGQMLLAIVANALQVDGDGVRFYEFPEPGAAALAAQFRAGLKTIHAEEATVADIIREAIYAFELHVRLFEELVVD